jgi:hypothetical protein
MVTQGVQPLDPVNSIPLVRSKKAVVNVLVECTPACAFPVAVTLRLYAADDRTLLYADTTRTSGPPSESVGYESPNAQFLVPAAMVSAVMRWQVEVDPLHEVIGNATGNDVFPSSGTRQTLAVDVPLLKLRFVPVELPAHSDAATVAAAQIPEFLRLVHAIYPIGSVSVTIGPAVRSDQEFVGDAFAFVAGVLADVDAERWLNETDLDTHWIGVLRRPPPPLVLSFGGMGYIPVSPSARGPGTRTVIVYQQLTWPFDPTSQEVVAHELGHNFGRPHSPCGGAPFPGAFPYAGGTIGAVGHDVFAWADSRSNAAAAIPASTGDIMGYCPPSWGSDFTYRAVANFRAAGAALTVAEAAPTRTMLITGRVLNDQRVVLDSLRTIEARPALPTGGRHRMRGIGADGLELFSHAFDPPAVSAATDEYFRYYLPLTPQVEAALRRVEVTSPSGRVVARSWPR